MTSTSPLQTASEETLRFRLSAFYFTLMTTSAVATPYLGLWLADRGLTPQEIGIANALPLLSLLLLNIFTGRIADLVGDWRKTIGVGVAVGCVTPAMLFFADGSPAIIAAWTLAVLPVNLIIPVTDAACVASSKDGSRSYARIRAWGTIGYMTVTFASGFVVLHFGIGAFPAMVLALASLRLCVARALPPLRPATAENEPTTRGDRSRDIRRQFFEMTRPWFFMTLIGGALINASHMLQNSFGAIFWQQAGLSAPVISILWVTATAAEIGIMLTFSKVAGRYPARSMLLASGVFCIIRWAGLALSPPLVVLLALQILHFATFGLSYLAMISFIANRTRPSAAASAQSFLSIIRQLTAVIALVGFGSAAQRMGIASYYWAAGLAMAGSAAIALSLWLQPASSSEKLS